MARSTTRSPGPLFFVMDPFVQQLADLCRAHVTRAKWVFVPTHAIGRTLGERIVLEGTNWLNLRFVTPLDIALRMGAPFLVERGIDPSEEGLGPALMMRLLLDLPLEGGYFRPLADQPTMAQALWTTVRELRMAGVQSGDLTSDAFASPAKHAELRRAARGVRAVPRDEQARRHGDGVRRGACSIRTGVRFSRRTAGPSCRTRTGSRSSAGCSTRCRASGSCRARSSFPARTIPRRLDATERRSRDAATAERHAAGVPDGAGSRQHRARHRALELFHAGGREAEIEEVFRRILAAARRSTRWRSRAPRTRTWRWSGRRRSATIGRSRSGPASRPPSRVRDARCIGLCDWIETDFSAGHLRRLLQSGDLGVEAEDEGFTAGQAARVLARAEAGWGRATYDLALGAPAQELRGARRRSGCVGRRPRRRAEAKADATAQRRAPGLPTLVASIPAPAADGKVPLQAVVDAALAFLEHRPRAAARSIIAPRPRCATTSANCARSAPFSCALPEALRFVRERVAVAHRRRRTSAARSSLRVQPVADRLRRVARISSSSASRKDACSRPRPKTRCCSTPSAPAISPALRRSTDRIDEAVYVGADAPARRALTERSTSTSDASATPCRDTREFRETYASWLMLQAFRLQQGNDDALVSGDEGGARRAEVGRACRSGTAAVSESGWWLRTVVGTGDEGIERRRGGVCRRSRAGARPRRSARSASFTEFDGYVPDAGPVARSVRRRQRLLGDRAREGAPSVRFASSSSAASACVRWTSASATRMSGSIRSRAARSCTTSTRRSCAGAATRSRRPTRRRMVPGC